MALPTYSTGTVSVAAGGTVVTGVGTIWSGVNVVPGDMIAIGGLAVVLITDVTDVTHLVIPAWGGAAQTAVAYVVYQVSSQRFSDVQIAQDLQKQVAALNTSGYFVFVPSTATVPDPSLGDDGQYAFQPSTGKWWAKSGGLWGVIGSPYGLQPAANLSDVGNIAASRTNLDMEAFGPSGTLMTTGDANTIQKNGFYQCSPAVPYLPTADWYSLVHTTNGANPSSWGSQYAVHLLGRTYQRFLNNGVWQPWQEVPMGNTSTARAAIGAVNIAGDTMTGALAFQNVAGGAWHIDTSGSSFLMADGASYNPSAGAGVWILTDYNSGQSAIYIVSGGTPIKVAGGSQWTTVDGVGGTTSVNFYAPDGLYFIRNNRGGFVSISMIALRTRNSA